MTLTMEQAAIIEQRLANEKKSVALAYLLLVFFGLLGVHRFYLGRHGLLFLVLGICSFFTIGLIWALIDLFLIPGMVWRDLEGKRRRLTNEVLRMEEGGAR